MNGFLDSTDCLLTAHHAGARITCSPDSAKHTPKPKESTSNDYYSQYTPTYIMFVIVRTVSEDMVKL
jgi:hypothetical protein